MRHTNYYYYFFIYSASLRIFKTQKRVKKILAYLVDPQTVHVMDLDFGSIILSLCHDSIIDWLEVYITS